MAVRILVVCAAVVGATCAVGLVNPAEDEDEAKAEAADIDAILLESKTNMMVDRGSTDA
jgi:hypothetical protein